MSSPPPRTEPETVDIIRNGRKSGFVRYDRDRLNRWRWTLHSSNGNKVACSGDGFQRLAQAKRNLNTTCRLLAML